MSKKNYRTLDGLYKALLKRKRTYAYEYKFVKKEWDVIVYNSEDNQGAISGVFLEDLMPVLKRCYWMISYNSHLDRMELVAWVRDDID